MEPRHGRAGRVEPEAGEIAVAARSVPTAPTRTFLRLVDRPRTAWSRENNTVVAGGAAVSITADGPDRIAAVRNDATAVFESLEAAESVPHAARPRLFGGIAFHEAHARPATGPWEGFPGARFVLPAVQLVDGDDGTWLTSAASGPDARERAVERLERWNARLRTLPERSLADPPGIGRRRSLPDRSGWRTQVETALDLIDAGDLRKVVLAQSLSVDLDGDLSVTDALARLARTYPDCTRFLVEPERGGAFFGATPERLVGLRGRDVETAALAGSTGRGDTDEEDAWLAAELESSAKDEHEHAVVREAIRDQLAPLTTTVETGARRVRRLATVQHLETPVRATLDQNRHVLDLVEALHPTPAVGGMPQDAALRTIREHEAFDRGWYASPVGWIDAAGDGEFAVALRSAVAREDEATLFAGAGIVGDSDPDREYSEVQLKYRPILDVLE